MLSVVVVFGDAECEFERGGVNVVAAECGGGGDCEEGCGGRGGYEGHGLQLDAVDGGICMWCAYCVCQIFLKGVLGVSSELDGTAESIELTGGTMIVGTLVFVFLSSRRL